MNHNINRAFQIIYIHQSWHIVMQLLKKCIDMGRVIATAMRNKHPVQLTTVSDMAKTINDKVSKG